MKLLLISILAVALSLTESHSQRTVSEQFPKGKLTTEFFTSSILKENLIGIDTKRSLKIYLPPGYESSGRAYPVVYFLHNIFWDNERMFADGKVVALMERAFASGIVGEFIFVVPDYRTPTTGSLYDNSPVSGRWLDHTINELIPYVDSKYRTLRDKNSRAIVGEFMGGRGALKIAMTYPEIFSVVYALHPVATGMGEVPWAYTPIDWKKIYETKSYPDHNLSGISQIFVNVCQTYLPNPNRPPLYCDFFMEPVNGEPQIHVENMIKARNGFSIGECLDDYAKNLRSLNGIAFDWGRFDVTHAHVDSNRELSRKLEDLKINHEAEEYAGGSYDKTWLDDGRFYARVLPFLARKMVFQTNSRASK